LIHEYAAFPSERYNRRTLITCRFYNPFTGDYLFRRVIRAVLISVKQKASILSAARSRVVHISAE